MPIIGVRELREHTAEILRKIRDEGAEYILTHRGKPVARLVPVREQEMERAMLQAEHKEPGRSWEAYAKLAGRIRADWPENRNSQEVLDGLRGVPPSSILPS